MVVRKDYYYRYATSFRQFYWIKEIAKTIKMGETVFELVFFYIEKSGNKTPIKKRTLLYADSLTIGICTDTF